MISRRTIELEAEVRRAPSDLTVIEALWSSLLEDGEPDAAGRWLAVLVRAWEVDEPYRALHALSVHDAHGGDAAGLAALRERLGLVFAFEELTRHEATARLKARSPHVDARLGRDELADQPVHWVEGDLRIPHLDLAECPPLIVTGTLEVAGSLVDATHPLSLLVVLGDLVAGQAVTLGELQAAGNVRVRGLWFLCSGNDYVVRVGGDVDTGVLFEDGMHTVVGGELSGARLISRHNTVTSARGRLASSDLPAEPGSIFASAVLEEGQPTLEKLALAARLELPMLLEKAQTSE